VGLRGSIHSQCASFGSVFRTRIANTAKAVIIAGLARRTRITSNAPQAVMIAVPIKPFRIPSRMIHHTIQDEQKKCKNNIQVVIAHYTYSLEF
jgi:hypothetical protein